MSKAQHAWAVVYSNGSIEYSMMAPTRSAVIAMWLNEELKYCSDNYQSDAQFWRWLKSTRGYSVRRINMKVAH